MLAVISPAKKLDFETAPKFEDHTLPELMKDTEILVKTAREMSRAKLKQTMKLSDTLADLNYQRYQDFSTPFHLGNAKQAAWVFNGDTYVGLQADTLNKRDMAFAQAEHAGEGADYLVSGVVAVSIIDRLEVVDVAHDNRAVRACRGIGQRIEGPAVEQVGQRVPFRAQAIVGDDRGHDPRHDKHHQAYVDKTNAAIEGTAHADASLANAQASRTLGVSCCR